MLAARAAQAAPSVLVAIGDRSPLGLPFSRFSEVALDDRGRAAFVGTSTAVFARTGETLAHLVGAGDVVLGRTVAGVDGPALGGRDCLAFRALFAGGGAAIAERCGGSVGAVAQVGQPAPGGRSFRGFGSDVALGGGGWLAFSAVLDDGTTGVFVADPDGSLGEVTRTGALSPAGGAFTSLRVIGVTGAGTVAFRGAVTSGPDGLFSWDGNALGRIAVVGDASPAGGAFTSVGLGTLNDAGVCAFRASISSGPRAGIFRAVVAAFPTLGTVALEGDATPLGGTFAASPPRSPRGSTRAAMWRSAPPWRGGAYRRRASSSPRRPVRSARWWLGMPATPGNTFLGFGVPSGNRHGAVAFTADPTNGGPTDAVVWDP